MGTWGPGIYQNDVASDIKESFQSLREDGLAAEEIAKQLVEEYAAELADEDDACPAMLALADLLWRAGKPDDGIQSAALAMINSGAAMQAWRETPASLQRRRGQALTRLHEKLLSPPPQPKPCRKPSVYVCTWQQNDVYAYRLRSDAAKKLGIDGWYYVFQKIDELQWGRDLYPIVYVRLCPPDKLPQNGDQLAALPFVPTGRPPNPSDPIADKEKTVYGDWVYRLNIWLTARSEKKELQFLGNFPLQNTPDSEYIYGLKLNTRFLLLKEIEIPLTYPWMIQYLERIL